MVRVAPSILSADFANLEKEIKALDRAGADMIHIDVMDGHFVPNITIGPCVIKNMRPHTNLPFDVHLMISSPEKYIEDFAKSGADIITVHYEATEVLKKVLAQIKSCGVKCGISLMPITPAAVLAEFVEDIDLILVMTVMPGFGGQQFMHDQIVKIRELSALIRLKNPNCLVSVDGGINDITGRECVKAGANMLVAGSFIFSGQDYATQIKKLK